MKILDCLQILIMMTRHANIFGNDGDFALHMLGVSQYGLLVWLDCIIAYLIEPFLAFL